MSERIALHDLAWELAGYPAGEGLAAGAAQNASGPEWFAAPFPQTVVAAHAAAGRKLPDDWREREWWYRCRFPRPGGKDRVVRLSVDGADYRAFTYLNGESLGEGRGAYGPVHYDVSNHLKDENVVAVCVHPLAEIEDRMLAPSRHPLRFENAGLPMLEDVGVWDDVVVSVSGPVYFEGWLLGGDAQGDHGDLNLRFEINNTRQVTQATVRVRVEGAGIAPVEQAYEVELATGLSQQEFSLAVPGARAWFPHTHGAPVLYTVKAELALGGGKVDEFTQAVGFRTVRAVRSGDEADLWKVAVNGKKIALHGVNWAALPLPAGQTYAQYLAPLAAAGVDAVRVWGGRHRGAFYAECDRLGILVIQEFPFGLLDGKTYPREAPDFPQAREILRTARADNNAFARHLRNHPSIALWVGGTRLHNQDNAHVMRTVEEALRLEDGTRAYQPVFPSPGVLVDKAVLTDGLSPEHYEDEAPLWIAHGVPAFDGAAPAWVPARWRKAGGSRAHARSVAWVAGTQRFAGRSVFAGEVRDYQPEGGFGLFDFAGKPRSAVTVLAGLYAPVAAGLSFDWQRYSGGAFSAEVWGVRADGKQLSARVWGEDAAGVTFGQTEVAGALEGGRGDLGEASLTLTGKAPFTVYVQADGGKPVPYPLDPPKPVSSYTLAEVAQVRHRLQVQTAKPRFVREFGIMGLLPVEYLVRGIFAARVAIGL